MDNCFTGRCDRSRQTSEKDVLYIIPAGPVRRVHSPGGASYFLSRQHGECRRVFNEDEVFSSTANSSILFVLPSISTKLSTTMSSPGQKRDTYGHVMTSFDGHSKCARCRDKGVGDDNCILKKDCAVCKGFTPEQVLQLATPTYREHKNKEKKVVASSPAPTLVDPSHFSVLGQVEVD